MFVSYVIGVVGLAAFVSGYGNWNSTHLCCGTNVFKRDSRSPIYCCGQETYDVKSQVCCGDSVILSRENDNNSCCGNEETKEYTLYNYSKFQCCNGVLTEKKLDKYLSCCDSTPFDYSTHFCCNKEIHPFDSDIKCCGDDLLYDSQTEICAYNRDVETWKMSHELVTVKNNHTRFCNKTLYDYETQACCWSKTEMFVAEKDESLRDEHFPGCCVGPSGTVVYNQSEYVCCEATGELLEIPDNLESNVRAQCCNGQLFLNESWQECCDDTLMDRAAKYMGFCCGSKMLLNYTTQICCNDVIYEQNENRTMHCCDDGIYDTNSHICCNGVQPGGEHAGCCYSDLGLEVYEGNTERCGSEGVTKIDSDELERWANSDPLCRRNNFL